MAQTQGRGKKTTLPASKTNKIVRSPVLTSASKTQQSSATAPAPALPPKEAVAPTTYGSQAPIAAYTPREQTYTQIQDEKAQKQFQAYTEELLLDNNEVLLYKAPPQVGLLVLSALGGSSFIATAVTTTTGVLQLSGESAGILIRLGTSITGIAGILCIAMGFQMISATFNQIQALRLVKAADGELKLRVDTKFKYLYFWQPKRLEVPIDQVTCHVQPTQYTTTFWSVDAKQRHMWTSREDTPMTFSARYKKWWANLPTDAGSLPKAIVRDTKKAFIRTGMLFVQVDKKKLKMDLEKCTVLDKGEPLDKLMKTDPNSKFTLRGMLTEYFASPK